MPSDMDDVTWKNVSVNGSTDDWLLDANSTTPNPWSYLRFQTITASDYALAVLYWVIFVVGVPGNLLVLAVVIWKLVKTPQHRTMTMFVGSLAVSDLGLLFWVTPLIIIYLFYLFYYQNRTRGT